MNGKARVLIICGPTASGKTELAVECAKLLKTEVISADSMNIYKYLDIGTAKPTLTEMQGVIHNMIDVVDPRESFSVGDYKELAKPILERLISDGKIPVICGGTGFYINSLIYDFSYGNGACRPEIREKYKKLAEIEGNEYIYNLLKEKDPESASAIHCNDLKRVIRALEIYENGVKKSEIRDEKIPVYPYKAYSYDVERDILYDNIDNRVDKMIEKGLVNEVKRLTALGITDKNQCMQGIGYKEIYEYLSGKTTLAEAIEKIKLNTRHYAKRQITFFKKLNGLVYIKKTDVKKTAEKIIDEL
ncbi:MAG: tRNA (adenosine(37)-N6)-dimethylallyltransferase MiaA [Candidatus Borkfalkiaceae bacterium]|nr:tRNA (adenosine(37)-N6)-dimethylallyltransferase MiaA [Christensenellaceae bacterium]